jgi:hypothetical protein
MAAYVSCFIFQIFFESSVLAFSCRSLCNAAGYLLSVPLHKEQSPNALFAFRRSRRAFPGGRPIFQSVPKKVTRALNGRSPPDPNVITFQILLYEKTSLIPCPMFVAPLRGCLQFGTFGQRSRFEKTPECN